MIDFRHFSGKPLRNATRSTALSLLIFFAAGIPHALAQDDAKPPGPEASPSPPAAPEIPPNPEKKDFLRRVKMDLRFGANLLDQELLQGIHTAIRYKYREEPTYIGDYHTRIDRYTVEATLRPEQIFRIENLPFSTAITPVGELLVARQMKSKWEAAKALPFCTPNLVDCIRKLPFTSRAVTEELKPGDFVSFRTYLNLLATKGVGASYGPINAGASTHVLVSGDFQVHVYRKADNHARLRIISTKGKQVGGGGSVDIGGIRAFGVRLLDRRIERLVGLNLIGASAATGKNRLFMMDYDLDLNDPDARAAYDSILSSSTKLRRTEPLNPSVPAPESNALLVSDLEAIDRLAREDRKRPVDQRRVHRVFTGSDVIDRSPTNFRIGINLAHYENNSAYSEHRIARAVDNEGNENSESQIRNHLYKSYSEDKDSHFLFRRFRSANQFTLSVLLDADEHFSGIDLEEANFSRHRTDKKLHPDEAAEFRERLRRNLPDSLYEQIPWGKWLEKRPRENAFTGYQITIRKEALASLPALSSKELMSRFVAFLKRPPALPGDIRPLQTALPTYTEASLNNSRDLEDRFSEDIALISRELAVLSSPARSPEERAQALMNLRASELFREIGAGFLLSLLPPERLEDSIQLWVDLSAAKEERLAFGFGSGRDVELQKSIQQIEASIGTRSFDLRMQEDLEKRAKEELAPNCKKDDVTPESSNSGFGFMQKFLGFFRSQSSPPPSPAPAAPGIEDELYRR